MPDYVVPRVLWESFNSVLLAQSRQYVKELAKRLKVPEKDLMKKVLPTADSIRVYMHDTQTEDLQCIADIQEGIIIHKCGRPVLLGTSHCSEHHVTSSQPTSTTTLTLTSTFQTVERIIQSDDINDESRIQAVNMNIPKKLWTTKDKIVIDATGRTIGHYNEDDSKLQLFKIVEEQSHTTNPK
jgi:hypothetical protein